MFPVESTKPTPAGKKSAHILSSFFLNPWLFPRPKLGLHHGLVTAPAPGLPVARASARTAALAALRAAALTAPMQPWISVPWSDRIYKSSWPKPLFAKFLCFRPCWVFALDLIYANWVFSPMPFHYLSTPPSKARRYQDGPGRTLRSPD
jgi:hypothetical protein